MVLLRTHIGQTLRQARISQGRTLRDVAKDARVSLGYLSEVERGQKEASSELLASICTALNIQLSSFLGSVTTQIAKSEKTSLTVLSNQITSDAA